MHRVPRDCDHRNVTHLQSNEYVGQSLTVSVVAVHRQCADRHLCQHIAQHLSHGARGAYANGVPQGYLITAQLKQPLCHLGRNRGKPWKTCPLWKHKQDEGVHTESSFWALEKHWRVTTSCGFFSKHRNKGLVGLQKLWEEKNKQSVQHSGRFITYWKAHLILLRAVIHETMLFRLNNTITIPLWLVTVLLVPHTDSREHRNVPGKKWKSYET